MLARTREQGWLAGKGMWLDLTAGGMKHSFYCKIDVYFGAEIPSPTGMKSLELHKMLLISSLFWAPVANCVFPRPVHTLPAQRTAPTMETE